MSALPTPKELIQRYTPTAKQKKFIDDSRQAIQEILDYKNPRFLLIVGPCSIHDINGALEFAHKLRKVNKETSSTLFLVMRTYFEKSRTSLGWKGIFHDPLLDGSNQIAQGLSLARQFLLHMADLEIPAACEFLDPALSCYIGDLISWGCIGARTATSQVHRQIASGLPMPVGFKNTTDGNMESGVNGVFSASRPHTYVGMNQDARLTVQHTQGNPYAHLMLRGGESGPNYDPESIAKALNLLKRLELPERLLVDCSHDNSEKRHEMQPIAFNSVIHQFLEGNQNIRGAMLESYLFPGNQTLTNNLKYGVSVTDPCLGWEMTESLLHWAHRKFTKEATQLSQTLKCASLS